MKELKCTVCKICNHKGKPSVSKYSVACNKRRKLYTPKVVLEEKKKQGFFSRLINRRG